MLTANLTAYGITLTGSFDSSNNIIVTDNLGNRNIVPKLYVAPFLTASPYCVAAVIVAVLGVISLAIALAFIVLAICARLGPAACEAARAAAVTALALYTCVLVNLANIACGTSAPCPT